MRASILHRTCLSLFLLFSLVASAYSQDNRRSVWLVNSVATIPDSLIIDSNSFSFESDFSEYDNSIKFDPSTRVVSIERGDSDLPDSIQLHFRVIEVDQRSFASRSLQEYDSTALPKEYFLLGQNEIFQSPKLFETGDVNTSGRISRGFTVGNTRDLLVNSTLNLNLDGKLAEDLFISASITDQNVPYQPAGNTAQLQDFDNVFMRIYNDKFSITGGDILLTNPNSRFLRYYKNVQGVQLSTNGEQSKLNLGASVAKGKFASVQIPAIDGVGGPYRIPGPTGQQFIIVIANSEKVFLDGKQLNRGYENDYTIDYNLGEITFNTSILITRYSRIRIDYEYADNQYNRSIITAGFNQKIGEKTSVFVQAYSEKDGKQNPNVDLSQEDIQTLIEAGDDPLKAITSSVDSVGFNSEKILYKKIDIDGRDVYVHSTNTDSAVFQINFNFVGSGNGNYQQTISSSNGKVFEYTSPINGVLQGDYAPFQILPAPDSKQMIVIGADMGISSFETIKIETAISQNDDNLFSPVDDENNNGVATNISLLSNDRDAPVAGYKLMSKIELEVLSRNFAPIDRFRGIEFDRNWSYQSTPFDDPTTDIFLRGELTLSDDDLNLIGYKFTRRSKGDYVNGIQNNVELRQKFGRVDVRSNLFTLRNDSRNAFSHWNRFKGDISYDFGALKAGYRTELDHNTVSQADSVMATANFFNEHTIYLNTVQKNNESGIFEIGSSIRQDYLPLEGELAKATLAKTSYLKFSKTILKNQNFQLGIMYRDIDVNEGLSADPISNSISGRLDWSGLLFNEVISSNLTYSIANSRELRREYIFLQVPTGEGNFHWIDSNEDGIKDLNEFFPAIHFDQRNYIKVFTPSQNFVDAFENLFNYRLTIRFPREWRKAGGLKSILYKISNTSSWNSTTKVFDDDLRSRFLAFILPIEEMQVLSLREDVRTTWFFNRTNPKFGLNATYRLNHFINTLAGGAEERKINLWEGAARINIDRFYTLKIKGSSGQERSNSEFLTGRDFVIDIDKIKPSIGWQPSPKLRFDLFYEYASRINVQSPEDGEFAVVHEVGGEFRINHVGKTNLRSELSFAEVDFVGIESSPTGYALLAGYLPGINAGWQVDLQQTLVDGLQLSLNYSGRKGEQSKTIHTGRIIVNALF